MCLLAILARISFLLWGGWGFSGPNSSVLDVSLLSGPHVLRTLFLLFTVVVIFPGALSWVLMKESGPLSKGICCSCSSSASPLNHNALTDV